MAKRVGLSVILFRIITSLPDLPSTNKLTVQNRFKSCLRWEVFKRSERYLGGTLWQSLQ